MMVHQCMPLDHQCYPAGLIIKDVLIVLGPSILGLIGVLWFFWDELPNWGW
jgi:hypothetical protein